MFNAASFATRWLLSVCLVFGTYNVSGYSYYHWIMAGSSENLALKFLVGWLLLVTYAVFAAAVWRSMGPIGISMFLFMMCAAVWMFEQSGLINLNDQDTVRTISEGIYATLIGVGVSFSHIKTNFTGQPEIRDVNSDLG